MQATHDVAINRPIEDVFDFLADGTNNRYWQPMVVSTELRPNPDDPSGSGRPSARRSAIRSASRSPPTTG